MESSEIVQRLIQGSHKLDRMEMEVWQVVNMVMALIPHAKYGIGDSIESELCRWVVTVGKDHKWVQCWKLTSSGTGILVFSSPKQVPFDISNVQFVHENLHRFIEVALKVCPALDKEWAPILNASRVQFAS